MNTSKPFSLSRTSAALLVSACLQGGFVSQLAHAEDLLTFSSPKNTAPAQAALISFKAEPVSTANTARNTNAVVKPRPTPVEPPRAAAVATRARTQDDRLVSFTPAQMPASEPSTPPASARTPATSRTVQLKPAPATTNTRHNKEQLLSFSPTDASTADSAIAPVRPATAPRSITAPAPANQSGNLPSFSATTAAKPSTETRSTEQPVYSVSALAVAALPPRLAARHSNGNAVMGPSEAELLQVFNRAVEAAIGRSPTIFRAQAEQSAAQADIDQAKGQRWPQVDVGTQSPTASFGQGEEQSGSGGINVAVTTPIYDWGRIRNSIDSRERLSDAADESLEAEKETTGYEVVTTLVELGKQRIVVDLSQQFADRMEDLVKMLAGIVAVDKGRYSELTQARARLLQAQALRDSADAKARDAEITLRKLVGERPIPIPRTKEWNIRLGNLDQLLEDAKTHPTVRQAIAETESAELQAKAVRAGGLPQLNWVVSKSTAEDSLGRETPWQTNISMTWGAFRGGSTRAAERAALQRADATRYQTDQQRRDLEFRIRTADHDARTQLERAELYRDLAVESGRIREDFYLQWHHLGKRTLLDVLSAENEHYGNLVNEINNRFDGYQAIVRQYAGAGTLARWLRNGS